MAEAESKGGEKKSSKKMILIILLVVLLLGAGGAGYFFFMKPAADAQTAHKTAEIESHEAEEEAHAPDDPTQAEQYYELHEPFIVNYPAGSSAKIIKVAVTVLVKGDAAKEAMKKHEPMIRNNLLMAISSVSADKARTLEGKQELQAMMLSEVGKIMEFMTKKNPVKALYFTEFVMQ